MLARQRRALAGSPSPAIGLSVASNRLLEPQKLLILHIILLVTLLNQVVGIYHHNDELAGWAQLERESGDAARSKRWNLGGVRWSVAGVDLAAVGQEHGQLGRLRRRRGTDVEDLYLGRSKFARIVRTQIGDSGDEVG